MSRMYKSALLILVSATSIALMGLSGCEVNIRFPANGASILGPTTAVEITYVNKPGAVLTVSLNGTDISDNFVVTGPDAHDYMLAVALNVDVPLGPNELTAVLQTSDATRATYSTQSDFNVILPPDPSGLVDAGPGVGMYSSIAYDSNGLPYISYYDEENGGLVLARYSLSVGFDSLLLDNGGGSGDVGLYSSLVVDENDVAYISYYDSDNGDLKLARLENMNLDLQTVDGVGDPDVGQFTSMAMDNTGKLYISYYDVTNGNLKLAVSAGSTFNIYTVDGAGVDNDVGSWSRIKVEANGRVHIAYEDRTNFDLKYAVGIAPNFSIYSVDNSSLFVGSDIGLDLKSNNLAVISYFDGTNLDLKFANETAQGVFAVSTILSDGATGFFSSVAVDWTTNNKVYITFYDHTRRSLWLATSSASGFQFTMLDDGGGTDIDVGRYTSLKLGVNHYLGVSYQDATDGALYYLRVQG